MFFTVIPEKTVKIVERFGKFHRRIDSGLHFLIPFIDSLSYTHSLKEDSIIIEQQTAVTKDNVSVAIDGNLFVQIEDPIKASYEIQNPHTSLKFLAQTVMRSEIGKMKLDELFQERNRLNKAIYQGVNNSSIAWGIKCLRYELLNIEPPEHIKKSMQYEAEAERTKRKEILLSEGQRQARINIQEGKRKAAIMIAEGRAHAVKIEAEQEKAALQLLAAHLDEPTVRDFYLLREYLQTLEVNIRQSDVTVVGDALGDGGLLALIAAAKTMAGQKVNSRPQHKQPKAEPHSLRGSHKAQPQPHQPESKQEKDKFTRFQESVHHYDGN